MIVEPPLAGDHAVQLPPAQLKALHAALLDAFPSWEKLELMLKLELGKNLAELSERAPLGQVILNVLASAEAEGWSTELMRAALARNPKNPELLALQEALSGAEPASAGHKNSAAPEFPTPSRPAWAIEFGRDSAGTWAESALRDIHFRLRHIGPGRGVVGSHAREPGRKADEWTRREIDLTRGFWIAETPCTQQLWSAMASENPSRFPDARRPVETVSWVNVQIFLFKLGEELCVPGVRLPAEAEWEYACRAGTATSTYAGDLESLSADALDSIGWYKDNSGNQTRPVGLKAPNPWGLHDMLGNVWEWCADSYDAHAPKTVRDPRGSERGEKRVVRGASWADVARVMRSSARFAYPPSAAHDFVGFRFVIDDDVESVRAAVPAR